MELMVGLSVDGVDLLCRQVLERSISRRLRALDEIDLIITLELEEILLRFHVIEVLVSEGAEVIISRILVGRGEVYHLILRVVVGRFARRLFQCGVVENCL